MNSDTSGGKRADSAPALADGANKRSPRAFVCMNIVSGAPVQNINNAGGGTRVEGGGATREAKQISGAHNGLIPMAVLSIMLCRRNNVGARLLVVVRRLSTLKDLPQLLESFPPSQRRRSPFHLQG